MVWSSSSQAQSNFTSSSGQSLSVDPRTGLANAELLLFDVTANSTQGPQITLAASIAGYSQSNFFGLGIGVSLGMSCYDSETAQLTVNTGEQYYLEDPVTISGSTLVTVKQQRMQSFKVYKEPAVPQGAQYRIVYKDGSVEILQSPGSSIYVPFIVSTPAGHYVTYSWGGGTESVSLQSIKDENDRTIVSASGYGSGEVTFTYWPDTVNTHTTTLQTVNNQLSVVTSDAVSPSLKWTFGYTNISSVQLQLLTSLSHPTGFKQAVVYSEGVMSFPGSSGLSETLPAVSQLTESLNSSSQPDKVTTYTYTPNNYLGYGCPGINNWQDQQDNMMAAPLATGFAYGSTSTVVTGSITTETTFLYNSYHLLTESKTSSTDGVHTTTSTSAYSYYAKEGVALDGQPAQYQSLTSEVVTLADSELNTHSLVTLFSYDEYGNLLAQRSPDGTINDDSTVWWNGTSDYPDGNVNTNNGTLTTTSFYPGTQDTYDDEILLCPASPNGFTTYPRYQTTTPADTVWEYNDEPGSSVEYLYSNIPCLAVSGAPLAGGQAVVQAQENHYSTPWGSTFGGGDDQLLSTRTNVWNNTATDEQLGLLSRVTSTLFPPDGSDSVTNVINFGYSLSDDGLQEIQTAELNTPDERTLSISRVQSTLNNTITSVTDRQGNITSYTYDFLGRVLSKTLNTGDLVYETLQRTAYTMDPSLTQVATTRTDASGNIITTTFNAAGHPFQVTTNANTSGFNAENSYVIQKQQYDNQGRAVAQYEFDYNNPSLDAASSPETPDITQQQMITYGLWGKPSAVQFGDNTSGTSAILSLSFNPAATSLTPDGGEQVTTATEQYQAQGVTTGWQSVQINPQGNVVSLTHFDHEGSECGTILSRYDGNGQLRQTTDEAGNITQFKYDVYGRPVQVIQPDGSQVNYTYFPDTTKSIIQQVMVVDNSVSPAKETVMGSREWDSLHRLTSQKVGDQQTFYAYSTDASPVPATITDAMNQRINMSYISQLSNSPDSLQAFPAGTGTATVTQSWDYDAVTGLMNAMEETGSQSQTFTHDAQGKLTQETVSPLRISDLSYQNQWVYTLQGRVQQYVDDTGVIQTFTYAADGKQTSQNDNLVNTDLTYDALQRLQSWGATDNATLNTLTTTLTFDDWSREVLRVVTDQNSNVLNSIATTWTKNGLTQNRLTTQGTGDNEVVLRDETYTYDRCGRILTYAVTGTAPPQDAWGASLASQTCTWNGLGNLVTMDTVTSSGDTDTAQYIYSNPNTPTQLTGMTHSNAEIYPATLTLIYDENGNVTVDEGGRSREYDPLNRQITVSGDTPQGAPITGGDYGYDASGKLVYQTLSDTQTQILTYSVNVLHSERQVEGKTVTRLSRLGMTPLAASETDNDGNPLS